MSLQTQKSEHFERLVLQNLLGVEKPETVKKASLHCTERSEPEREPIGNLEEEYSLAVQKFLAGEDLFHEEEESSDYEVLQERRAFTDAPTSSAAELATPARSPTDPECRSESASSKIRLEDLIVDLASQSAKSNADIGTVRGQLLAQQLRQFPKRLKPEDWIKFTLLVQCSIRELYTAGRQTTVSAVKDRMRSHGAEAHLVTDLLRLCAQLSAVFTLWVPPGSEPCILAGASGAQPSAEQDADFQKAIAARLRSKLSNVVPR
mmetsp:Transcript_29583/g.55361  ORF Transcript_29583/g.55361 Transcript_29583/m.55361 type:complete len:263 (+) Transcript_29583:108-896(+)